MKIGHLLVFFASSFLRNSTVSEVEVLIPAKREHFNNYSQTALSGQFQS